MLASDVMLYGSSKETGVHGIYPRQHLALIDPYNQFFRPQLPQRRYPMFPWRPASEATMLKMWFLRYFCSTQFQIHKVWEVKYNKKKTSQDGVCPPHKVLGHEVSMWPNIIGNISVCLDHSFNEHMNTAWQVSGLLLGVQNPPIGFVGSFWSGTDWVNFFFDKPLFCSFWYKVYKSFKNQKKSFF